MWRRGEVYFGWVVLRDRRVQKSFDTKDRGTATNIESMLALLRAKRD